MKSVRDRARDSTARPAPAAAPSSRDGRGRLLCRSPPSVLRRAFLASPSRELSKCPWHEQKPSSRGPRSVRRSARPTPACAENGHGDDGLRSATRPRAPAPGQTGAPGLGSGRAADRRARRAALGHSPVVGGRAASRARHATAPGTNILEGRAGPRRSPRAPDERCDRSGAAAKRSGCRARAVRAPGSPAR